MDELDDTANVPAGHRVQLLSAALENDPGPQAMQPDALDNEYVPLGHGVHALLPPAAQVPALHVTGKPETAELQDWPGGHGMQAADAGVEYVPGVQGAQTLGEKAPRIDENVPAGQAAQDEKLKYVPTGHGEQGDAMALANVSAAPSTLV